ncbi:MAG: NAD-dependent epimerase/dehydratase family protein [Parcubacteria group bacterium]|nr:NAD-dependent epimerase/dehydratase family protein [Parcubacteria group bacterium]
MKRVIRETNVCVIGGAGFLGSHLVDHLINDRDCEVLVLDNLITGLKKFLHPRAEFMWCDITHSEEQLRKIFIHNHIQYVFNYAAEPYIPVSFSRPLHVFDINTRGALMVINAAQEGGVKGVLQVSSAEIYGDIGSKIKETDTPQPHSSYGASKLAIDALVQCRWREAKAPVIALRQFNCVGERETHEYVVPVIIDQVSRQSLVKLGNNSYRDFQYAGDAVRMAVELLEKGDFGEVYNMGSEEGIHIYDLAKMIGRIVNVEVQVQVDPRRIRPWEIWHLQSDNAKLYSVIKRRPEVSLEEALRRTISYFLENGKKWDFELSKT